MKSNVTTFIYRPFQPIATVKRHIVIVPENAEYESGFSFWLARVWNIGINTGAKTVFYASEQTIKLIQDIHFNHPIEVEFNIFDDWDDFLILSKVIKKDDNIVIVMSRKNSLSYQSAMFNIPKYLNKYFQEQDFILIYPSQSASMQKEKIDLTNPSLIEAVEKIDIIGKTLANIFRKK
jgi:hypothetical protein